MQAWQLSQTKWKPAVMPQILSMSHLVFIPVFFISIGLEMSISGVVNNWQLLMVFVVAAVFTKLFGACAGALNCQYSLHSALFVGSGMISRGEVALIIAQLGYTHSLLSSSLYSVVVSAVIITTILAPIIMKKLV